MLKEKNPITVDSTTSCCFASGDAQTRFLKIHPEGILSNLKPKGVKFVQQSFNEGLNHVHLRHIVYNTVLINS